MVRLTRPVRQLNFEGIKTLQRYAEIGLGIVLDIDVKPIKPKDSKATQTKEGLSHTNYAIGTINYPDGTVGTFIYLKHSFTGNESEYLYSYKQLNATFPRDSSSDQSFDETQFEVYRALGDFVTKGVGGDFRLYL